NTGGLWERRGTVGSGAGSLRSRGMSSFAVWALGADRPGIVAAVTGGLFQLGGNLLDTSMTILSGHFAMMLLVETPEGIDEAQIEQALAAPAAAFDLVVAARAVHGG